MKSDSTQQLRCDVPYLWLEHKNALRNFIYKRVKDKELTDDLLQEVLLKVYNFCSERSGVKNVKSWLFTIARNTIVDHFRRQAKLSGREVPEQMEEDENLAFKEALDYIEPLLSFLPEEYALPLKMADINGIKQADIASQLNLSLPATKSRIQRARDLLKKEFKTCCHYETSASGNLISFEIKDSCAPLQEYKKRM